MKICQKLKILFKSLELYSIHRTFAQTWRILRGNKFQQHWKFKNLSLTRKIEEM